MRDPKIVIDLFCGAGGESCGIHSAFEKDESNIKLFAVNHWEVACETHAANFPSDECICQDIQTVIPTSLVKPGQSVELFWASPECFTADTLILTDKGYMPISEIKVGDTVLSHAGKWRKVTHIMQSVRPTVVVSGYGHYGLRTTENHPFYAADRIKIQHHRSFEYSYSKPSFMPISEIKKRMDNKNTAVYWSRLSSFEALPIPKIDSINGREFDIDERMMWLAGRYVADGYVRLTSDRADITISCGALKHDSTKEMLSLWPRKGKKSGRNELHWSEHKVRTAINFIANSKGVAKWLVDNFGKHADGKFIPSWLYGASEDLRKAFIRGYMAGDGYFSKGVFEASTVSKKLAFGMVTLLASLRINSRLYKPKARPSMRIEDRVISSKQQYVVKWRNCIDPTHNQTPSFDESHLWGAIKNISRSGETETVYNISVEEDESYIAEGICVHNCTHFSTARGGKPMDDQSRCTPFDIIRWLTMIDVKRVIIENVSEFETWGPLGQDCRPIKEQKGSFFSMFISAIRNIGYTVDWKICNAADYGAPTTRRRLFIQAVKKGSGKVIRWPEQLYSENPDTVNGDLFGTDVKPWIPASEIIDWTLPCEPIENRKKPLSENTMERIKNGIRKYWGDHAEPFLVRYNGGTNRHHSIHEPVPTLDTSNRYGLVMPLIMEYYGNGKCRPVSEPLGTITCKDRFALISPEDYHIGFRMLQPHELAAAQSFPDWYTFTGTKADKVRQIGNAVCPKMAEALVV